MTDTCGDLIEFVESGTFSAGSKSQCVRVMSSLLGDGWEDVPLRKIVMPQAEKRFKAIATKEGLSPNTAEKYFSVFGARRREYENARKYMVTTPESHDEPRAKATNSTPQDARGSRSHSEVIDIPLPLSTGMGKLSVPEDLTEDDLDKIHSIASHYVVA